jgi:hypothetical protein
VLPDLLSYPELSVLCPSLTWYSECFSLAQQFLSPSHLGHVLLPRENIVFTLIKRTKIPNDTDSETSFSDIDSVETNSLETSFSDIDSVETNSLEFAADYESGNEIVTDLVSIYFVQSQILTEGNPITQ